MSFPKHKKTDDKAPLTAPYNFVPLSEEVVRPGWAHHINQDTPIDDDPQSGVLKLKITARQPIYTRNSVPISVLERKIEGRLSRERIDKKDAKNSQRVKEIEREVKRELQGFSFWKNQQGKYYIPGSSLKGAIRNVLEIMSFGDLAKGLNNEPWAMRDLDIPNYKTSVLQGVRCGWLSKSGNDYVIEDCGSPRRITHSALDNVLGGRVSRWMNGFKDRGSGTQKFNLKKGSAFSKRKEWGLQLQEPAKNWTVEDGETIRGRLVVTGQPSLQYDNSTGIGVIGTSYGNGIKYKEFIFPELNKPNQIPVPKETVEAFRFAYPQENLRTLPMPVFFHIGTQQKEDGEEQEVVCSFGTSLMYKIPFTNSVKKAIERFQSKAGKGPDLAACIFGHIENNVALKGRVYFGHAKAEGLPTPMEEKSEVLNSPKPTYYPTYVRQQVKPDGKIKGENYKTLFDEDAVPSGWKRYPVNVKIERNKGELKKDNEGKEIENMNVQTQFCPLPATTEFNCKIYYHNLNKVELGALLSAITFHNTPDCFHTLGMAKPLGYGKCSIEIKDIDKGFLAEMLYSYEQYMERKLDQKWLNSPQLLELIGMSQEQDYSGRRSLTYMTLANHRNVKLEKKSGKQALDVYSKLGVFKQPALRSARSSEEPTLSEEDKCFQECDNRKRVILEMLKTKQADHKRQEELLKRQKTEARNAEVAAEQEAKQMAEKQAVLAAQNAVFKAQEDERNKKALREGINLNGVNEKEPINGLGRAYTHWKEKIKGNMDAEVIIRTKARLNALFKVVKAKKRAEWLEKVRHGINDLHMHLSAEQINDIKGHLTSLK